MDINLAKTFLEIASTGSFVAAAERLNLTQTAVSARIRGLEDQLGRKLFIRNKSGARLTPAGERFIRHARTLVQVWDHARHQVGLPQGRADIASVGAELSLWYPILSDWLVWMKNQAPNLALRAHVQTASQLLDSINNGALDLAVLYDPPPQSGGTVVELLTEETLIMVSTHPHTETLSDENYVHVDWGNAFQVSQQAAFPQLASPTVAISHGPLALDYLKRVGGTGYFRKSVIRPYVEAGQMTKVADAPEFSYSVHMVYSSRTDLNVINVMRRGFQASIGETDI